MTDSMTQPPAGSGTVQTSRAIRADALDGARRQLGLTVGQLWLECMRLGGNLSPDGLNTYLDGGPELTDYEHDVIAHALNERFSDRDGGRPLAYADQLDAPPTEGQGSTDR